MSSFSLIIIAEHLSHSTIEIGDIVRRTRAATLVLLASVLAFATNGTLAQTHVRFTSFLVRDSNTFKTRLAYNDWINSSNLRLGHAFGNEKYQIQGLYSGEFLLLSNRTELNNHTHTFGVTGTQYGDVSAVNINASVRVLNYRESFSYYNANQYSITGTYQYTPSLQEFYSLGLVLSSDNYRTFDELDNSTYRIYVRAQRFLQSQLSITGELGLGVKDYTNQSVISYFGSGFGPMSFSRVNEAPVKAAIISASVNVGKSITSHTGLSGAIGGQWFTGDPIVSYSNGIYYYTENDLYDDPYAYQGPYGTLQLTEQIASDFQLKLGAKVQRKDYSGTPALNEIGDLTGVTRNDTRREYSLMISKSFVAEWPTLLGIDIFFSYMLRSNSSNDPHYNFKDHIGLIGFSVGI